MVVDGYHFSAEYLRTVSVSRSRLLVICDDGELPGCNCDIVVDPGIQEKVDAELGQYGELLAGPAYALVRREFLEYAKQDKDIPERAHQILITFGGGDFPNASLTVLDALEGVLDFDLNVTVVIGPSNPHGRQLRRAAGESRHRIDLVEGSNDMADIMGHADMAITGGGGTCYELALMRVPMVLIPIAENQVQLASAYGSADAAVLAGRLDRLNRMNLGEVLHRVIGDRGLRQRLIDRASAMVDGKGAVRIVQRMLAISEREKTDAKARN
jgi:spore coat polysaccharide biosynthesis predicted glycosyltransferase SpsG